MKKGNLLVIQLASLGLVLFWLSELADAASSSTFQLRTRSRMNATSVDSKAQGWAGSVYSYHGDTRNQSLQISCRGLGTNQVYHLMASWGTNGALMHLSDFMPSRAGTILMNHMAGTPRRFNGTNDPGEIWAMMNNGRPPSWVIYPGSVSNWWCGPKQEAAELVPFSPWVVHSGAWTITEDGLTGGANALDSFGFAYATNTWTNYSVEARIRFSSTAADAGGIGGRFNPYSGGHYAAWITPERSASGSNILQLLKFQYWLGYEYTNSTWQAMREVPLPSVGTNWHTLKLWFQGNQITVYYDGIEVTSITDAESNPFWTGGICAGMSTANTPFTMFVDDVVVSLLPSTLLAVNDFYCVNQNGSLTVPSPGVLSNDTSGANTNVTAVRLTNPSQGTLSFSPNGSFTYVPRYNFVGVDSFTYLTSDGASNSLPATVVVDVTPSTNIFFDNFTRSGDGSSFAPWVTGLGEWTISDGVMLGSGTIPDYYSDAYVPAMAGDFSIQARFQLPAGAWACGLNGRLNPATGERYVANVYPEGSPFGPTPALRLIKFHSWGTWSSSYTPMALVGLPGVGTSFHTLKIAFYGQAIDVYYDGERVVHAIDNNVDDLPPYRSGAFGAHMYMNTPYQAIFDDLTVTALPPFNFPPVLPVQTDLTVAPQARLVVTNTASDPDIPTNTLSYTLRGPVGATIDSSGVINWTPGAGQASTTNLFTTVVTDTCPGATNALHLSATNTFVVIVSSRPGSLPGWDYGPGEMCAGWPASSNWWASMTNWSSMMESWGWDYTNAWSSGGLSNGWWCSVSRGSSHTMPLPPSINPVPMINGLVIVDEHLQPVLTADLATPDTYGYVARCELTNHGILPGARCTLQVSATERTTRFMLNANGLPPSTMFYMNIDSNLTLVGSDGRGRLQVRSLPTGVSSVRGIGSVSIEDAQFNTVLSATLPPN
jgi:Bacterial Ig domain